MKKILLASVTAVSLFGASGEELFIQKCATCHTTQAPSSYEDMKNMVAPFIGNVLFHLDKEFKSSDDIKNHINDFVMNPTKEKAICNSVKRFGLMPSQKGLITEAELEKVANYLTTIIEYARTTKSTSHQGASCSTKGGEGCGCKSK